MDCYLEDIDELILHSEEHKKCSIEVEFRREQEVHPDFQELMVLKEDSQSECVYLEHLKYLKKCLSGSVFLESGHKPTGERPHGQSDSQPGLDALFGRHGAPQWRDHQPTAIP